MSESEAVAALLLGTAGLGQALARPVWLLPGVLLGLAGLLAWAAYGEDESPVLLSLAGRGLHVGDALVLPSLALLVALVRRR